MKPKTHKRRRRRGEAFALCGDRRATTLHNWWALVDCEQCLAQKPGSDTETIALVLAMQEVARATANRSAAGLDAAAGEYGVDEELLSLIEAAVDADAEAVKRSEKIMRRLKHLRESGYKP